MRRLLLRSERWKSELWGAPINQHDMAATSLLFSVVFLSGIRQFGVRCRATKPRIRCTRGGSRAG
ncbi:MAG: hypothetical protein R3B99_14890 [Polyangiales bacterium]